MKIIINCKFMGIFPIEKAALFKEAYNRITILEAMFLTPLQCYKRAKDLLRPTTTFMQIYPISKFLLLLFFP